MKFVASALSVTYLQWSCSCCSIVFMPYIDSISFWLGICIVQLYSCFSRRTCSSSYDTRHVFCQQTVSANQATAQADTYYMSTAFHTFNCWRTQRHTRSHNICKETHSRWRFTTLVIHRNKNNWKGTCCSTKPWQEPCNPNTVNSGASTCGWWQHSTQKSFPSLWCRWEWLKFNHLVLVPRSTNSENLTHIPFAGFCYLAQRDIKPPPC